ncbi:hypothetical protein ACIF83_07955 [Streptomyces sp. NPDC085866]|uniref:hypothetical protein n=1 Tax=Streptomyces sp. NPDC085866 TaxID=3365736 RepID=UPI0037D733E2
MMYAVESYLEAAREAGLLRTVSGLPCVAGVSTHPLSDVRSLLVEYADPELLSDPGTAPSLWRALLTDQPEVSVVVVRAGAQVRLPRPWQRDLTYVRLAADADVPVAPDGPRVTPAEEEHRPLLADWLVRAILHAAREQGRPADPGAAAAEADALLDTPSRRSLLVWEHGVPVGHATVICGAWDEISAQSHMELVDVLVEPDADAPAGRGALVAAVADLARAARTPLIGHVVHGPDGNGDRVTESLCARGWTVDHRYWRARTEELAAALKGAGRA